MGQFPLWMGVPSSYAEKTASLGDGMPPVVVCS